MYVVIRLLSEHKDYRVYFNDRGPCRIKFVSFVIFGWKVWITAWDKAEDFQHPDLSNNRLKWLLQRAVHKARTTVMLPLNYAMEI